MMRTVRFLAPVALLAVAGCFKLSRNAPPTQQYVLSGARSAGVVPAAADAGGLTIGIRRMDLASYLATQAIVVRRGTHEIVTSRFHRWGEELGEAINRTVAVRLTNAPSVKAVDVAPWAAQSRHDYLLQLHVSRFEGVADSTATTGSVHVLASWDIIRPVDGAVLVRGTSDSSDGRFSVGDYESLVSALNAALEVVARDVGTCLGRFRSDSLPPPSC